MGCNNIGDKLYINGDLLPRSAGRLDSEQLGQGTPAEQRGECE